VGIEMKMVSRSLIALMVVLSLDWLTKTWVEQSLVPFQPVPLAGQFFRLTLGYNTGVAFGLFANGGVWPLVVTGLIIVGMAIWLVNTLRSGELPSKAVWPIGLILGGATANFVDRLPDGRVTDFLDAGFGLTRFPTFNLADTFIVLGVAILLLFSVTDKQPEGSGG
jgi:signal peptidase II